MSVRAFSLIVMLAFSASMAYSSLHAAENERRPNFVFILADDLGPGDLSCCGGTSAKTPVLDQLAAEGIRFTQFTVASPICSPSRVAFTTGMYPSRWRISSYLNTRKGNREAEQADYLDPRAPSLARLLKSHGYATGHFGKWHMGGGRDVDDAPKISVYGFDAWHGTWESPDAGEDPRNLKGDQAVPHHLRTPFFLAKAADFIKAHRSGPFYVQIWLNQVHDAHIPSPEKLKTLGPKPTKQQKAAADVEEMDAHLKPFLDVLNTEGLDRNTVIVFTGDNGPNPSFDHDRTLGLRGQKWSLYEGGLREPLIVRWPGKVPAGRVDDTSILSAIDYLPTLAALAGVPTPKDARLDGIDASQAWLGTPLLRERPLFWEYARNAMFLRPPVKSDWSPNVAIREGRWKLLVNATGREVELYDLTASPKETTNVKDQHPDVARRMCEQALAWRHSLPK